MKIDVTNVIELLEKVVNRRGANFIYRDRYNKYEYFHPSNSQPKCIVGAVLYEIGIRYSDIREMNGKSILHVSHHIVPKLEIDIVALQALSRAQGYQDKGHTWGEALEVAKRVVLHKQP